MSLDFKVFESLDSDSLAKKIKALAGKFGYFEVIFKLEKAQCLKPMSLADYRRSLKVQTLTSWPQHRPKSGNI